MDIISHSAIKIFKYKEAKKLWGTCLKLKRARIEIQPVFKSNIL